MGEEEPMHLALDRFLVERYRAMSPDEKLERVAELTAAVRQLALTRLRLTFPAATDRELELRLTALWLDAETMRAAFGWSPDDVEAA